MCTVASNDVYCREQTAIIKGIEKQIILLLLALTVVLPYAFQMCTNWCSLCFALSRLLHSLELSSHRK